MRILHLIHSEGVYGAELILLYLAREQQQRGHEPLVGSIRDPGTQQTPFEALAHSWGLRVVPIRIAPRPTPGVVRSLLRTVSDVAPDVLHSHGYKPNILLGFLPRRLRGPMLTTLHGWTGAPAFSALWLYERLDRLSLRRIDSVVVVTRSMLELRALQSVPPFRRHVIENGIPPREVRLADLAARGVAPLPDGLLEFTTRQPTLIAIGRLSPEKGFMLLLEAFARARSQSAQTHQLLIVGEGSERDVLERRIATLGLSDVVRVPGYVDLDAGLSKSFTMPYNEHHHLQFRWEVFNVLNHPLFAAPGGDISTGAAAQITALSGDPRVMQFALRVDF